MSQPLSFRVILAATAVAATAGLASAGDGIEEYQQVIYDMTGVEYMGGPPAVEVELEIGGGSQVMALHWEDIVIETFDNTGVPNWGSEAYFGFQAAHLDGTTADVIVQPFPDANQGGQFGPVDGSLDTELDGLFAHNDSKVYLLTGATWVDGSGEPAGQYLSGKLIIEYLPIPGPATLAVLGLAGLPWRRRRR
ncbi:MAG: hypothetical protein QF561_03505 [Phycisphaerales bacterium]|nr:hypothetical protein [Phycisphaerales bacterium]